MGLATAAVRVFMHDWAVAQMGATELRAKCFASNIGSVRLVTVAEARLH